MKPILFNTDMVRAILEDRKTVTRRVVKPQPEKSAHSPYECCGGRFAFRIGERGCTDQRRPPYRPSDILYVRETWAPSTGGIVYKASLPYEMPKWRPSIHMPREAARIFLRVTDVRVEKLRPMGLDDFEAEGLSTISGLFDTTARFADIWDTTIKPADRALYGWEANPWGLGHRV